MTRRALTVLALALAVGAGLPCPVLGQAADERSILDGVYTEEQAQRGGEINQDVCAACHTDDWFTGTFLQIWSGATVNDLYELIRTTMPQDRPGGLKRQEYADVVAYIFDLNGIPAGDEELKARKQVLQGILIEAKEQ